MPRGTEVTERAHHIGAVIIAVVSVWAIGSDLYTWYYSDHLCEIKTGGSVEKFSDIEHCEEIQGRLAFLSVYPIFGGATRHTSFKWVNDGKRQYKALRESQR